MVSIIYSLQNSTVNEKGTIAIIETDDGYGVDTISHASVGKYSAITFEASAVNGSLLLEVIGTGGGEVTEFKYRINTFNTLSL